jgi:methionyl-tRNA synthetase
MISIDDFKKIEIKAGKVEAAERVEGSEKLLKLTVNFGEETPRQVISGIAKFITPEEITGKTWAFVVNLEPREIMGLQSQAMIMAASGGEEGSQFFSLLEMKCPPGAAVK